MVVNVNGTGSRDETEPVFPGFLRSQDTKRSWKATSNACGRITERMLDQGSCTSFEGLQRRRIWRSGTW